MPALPSFRDLPDIPNFLSPQLAVLASALVDGTREWRSEMELVPTTPAAMTFQVREGQHSAGAVLAHIADVEAKWMRTLGLPYPEREKTNFDVHLIDPDNDVWPAKADDYAAILAWQDQVRARTLAFLITLEADQVTEFREDRPDCTAAWVVNHLIGHEAYHAGQAVLLAHLSSSR
jgi:uncharacterized damage-inducible protein DinB